MFVEDLNIALGRRASLDEPHQRAGVGLQGGAVIVDAVQHDGGDREHHAGRGELPFGQDVMDQAAVHAAVAVLEGVNIDEAEGGGGWAPVRPTVSRALAARSCARQSVRTLVRRMIG